MPKYDEENLNKSIFKTLLHITIQPLQLKHILLRSYRVYEFLF